MQNSTLTALPTPAQRGGAQSLLKKGSNGIPTWSHESTGQYSLATGEAGAYRLHLLHSLYGPGTRQLLQQAGLKPGMRVADIGCGVGTVTRMLADLVGPDGEAVGVDVSEAQLAQARRQIDSTGRSSIRLVEASATDTGLPSASFDLVYCRFLLLHLPDPAAALREMYRLLKPGGILACEDGDLTSAGSEPSSALELFGTLFRRLGPTRGLDYTLGRRLYHMVQIAGFPTPEITYNQPVIARGENKRMLELSVAEAGPAFVGAGLITEARLEESLREMRRLALDDGVLAVMVRMAQVWARKPAGWE